MTQLTFDDPCLLFALRREAGHFLRLFPPQQRFPGAPCWARFCGPAWLSVLVVETGVGRAGMEKALTWLLSEPLLGGVPYRPRAVISAGFSGALQDNLQVGDLILATEVVDEQGHCWPATWPGALPAGDWRPPLVRGRILTCRALVGSSEAKRVLGTRHHALAADMETAAVACSCSARGIAFGCVRAISDDARTSLSPQFAALLSGGRVSPWRLLAAVARTPGFTRELWQLAGQTKLAARQLAKALGELLTLTLPWGADL